MLRENEEITPTIRVSKSYDFHERFIKAVLYFEKVSRVDLSLLSSVSVLVRSAEIVYYSFQHLDLHLWSSDSTIAVKLIILIFKAIFEGFHQF